MHYYMFNISWLSLIKVYNSHIISSDYPLQKQKIRIYSTNQSFSIFPIPVFMQIKTHFLGGKSNPPTHSLKGETFIDERQLNARREFSN